MRIFALVVLGLMIVCICASCVTQRRALRPDDPYLYKRGPWNVSKGGIVDDIPQFLWQMLESLLDFGPQPIDPPSIYEPETVGEEIVSTTTTTTDQTPPAMP
jgi:hypothetical protein